MRSLSVHLLLSVLLIACGLSVGSTVSAAQADTGTIVGTVRDSAGAVVVGARVVARDRRGMTARETHSSETGTYEVPGLAIGTYELSAEIPGFKRVLRQHVTVEVNHESRVDFVLEPGEISEVVVVVADAGLVQTGSATLGTVVGGELIQGLPLNGRNFYDLGLLQTGVTPLQPGRTLTKNSYNVNGARDTANNFLLDGVANQELEYNSIQIQPSIDAIAEFKIQTSNYSAEFGRGGGSIVNVVIRSGTPEYHGSAWEFFRHDALDARNFFSSDVPHLRRNQFGGTIGGPVGIPGVRRLSVPTYFFASFEALRLKRGVTEATVVPTERERLGDLSHVLTPIIDPVTGMPFPNNIIPEDRISPAARALLELYPLPNVSSSPRSLNFTASPTQTAEQHQAIVRIDHAASTRDALFGRYVYDNFMQDDPYQALNAPTRFPGFSALIENRNHNLAVGYTRTITPSLINDARFGFSRTVNPNTFEPVINPRSVGINLNVPANVGLPDVRIAGMSGVGNSIIGPLQYGFETYQFLDSITYVSGRNTIRAGVEYRRHLEDTRIQFVENGQFVFAGVHTGDAFADFLLGRAFFFTYGQYERDELRQRWSATSLFLQDDIRLTQRLTVNIGLRYEYITPIVDAEGRAATIFIRSQPEPGVPQSGVAETVLAGTNGLCDKCTYLPDRNNVAPRVGFAYDVFGDGRLAVRGGYGVFFNQLESNLAIENLLQPPFATFPFIVDSGGVGFASLDDPTCGGGCVPPGLGLVLVTDPYIRTPYMQHYSLGVQSELLPDHLLDIEFVGTAGRKLLQFRDINQPIFIPGTDANGAPLSTLGNKDLRRPFPGYGTIAQSTTYGRSSYNALQVNFSKRFSLGHTYLVGYTYSKSIDLASQYHSGSGSPVDPAVAQDSIDTNADRGLSSFDMRHRLTVSGVFELPFGVGKRFSSRKGVVNLLVGGWSVSPILTVASGVPLTVRDFTDPCLVTGPFLTSCRPNLVGNPILPDGLRTPERWIDRSAFARQPLGSFGTAGRNIVFADGAENLNLAVVKQTKLSSDDTGALLEFRAEFFNLFNHTQFGAPDLDVSSPTFGRIFTTALGATERQIQFGLKLHF